MERKRSKTLESEAPRFKPWFCALCDLRTSFLISPHLSSCLSLSPPESRAQETGLRAGCLFWKDSKEQGWKDQPVEHSSWESYIILYYSVGHGWGDFLSSLMNYILELSTWERHRETIPPPAFFSHLRVDPWLPSCTLASPAISSQKSQGKTVKPSQNQSSWWLEQDRDQNFQWHQKVMI